MDFSSQKQYSQHGGTDIIKDDLYLDSFSIENCSSIIS